MDQFMWGFVAGVATFCFCGIVVGLAGERREKRKAAEDRLHERLNEHGREISLLNDRVWNDGGLISRIYTLECKVNPQRRKGDKKGKSCACR